MIPILILFMLQYKDGDHYNISRGGIVLKPFDRVYRHYDRFMELCKLYKWEEINNAIQLEGWEVVVDIGGGTGQLANHLSCQSSVVYVLDESEGMLSKVKKNSNVIPLLGDGLHTPFQDASVDVVVLADVLHHVQDQVGLLQEIQRILKGGGRLLILDFERKHPKTQLLRLFEYPLFGRLDFRSVEEVKQLLKEDFTISQCINKSYYFIVVGEKDAK